MFKEICDRVGRGPLIIVAATILSVSVLVGILNTAEPPLISIFRSGEKSPSIMVLASSEEAIMTIYPDGRITVSEKAKPTEAAKKVIEAMQIILMHPCKADK